MEGLVFKGKLGSRHPSVCPRCMAYMLDHYDPELKKNNWKRCGSCGFCEINISAKEKQQKSTT